MTPEEMCAAIEAILEPHRATTASMLGGTAYFVDERLVVAVIGDRLCRPTGDSAVPVEDEPFLFAGRPVPGWSSQDPASLDLASLTANVVARLDLLWRSWPDAGE
jgi:hypothetical protein